MASLKEKIGYALGDAAAGGITWKVMSIAFPLFFTNVFGLSLVDAGVLMLIARLFDVVTDPLMGSLSDRTQSKWGTYRPWLIIGAIPFGLIFALLLYTPDFPYGSLLGVMTDDDNEKNQFSSFRMVGAYAMGFITLLSFPYVQNWIGGDEYVNLNAQLADLKNNTNPSDAEKGQIQALSQQLVPMLQHQYAVIGALFGALAATMTLVCGLLTKERLKPKRAEKFSFKQFADLVKNKPWVYLTLIGVCTNFFNGFRYAVAGYMFTYCLNGDVTLGSFIINYTVFMAFGEVICMIFGGVSPKFTEWAGSKKKAFTLAAIICTVTSVLFFFIPMQPGYMWLMITVVVLTSIGVGLYSPLLWSMYADVADYATEKNGTSSTGLIFSSGTMAQKLGGAVSGSLIALLLGVAGATMIEDAMGNTTIDPASVTDSVKNMIWMLFSIFPAIMSGLMILLLKLYPIKK